MIVPVCEGFLGVEKDFKFYPWFYMETVKNSIQEKNDL